MSPDVSSEDGQQPSSSWTAAEPPQELENDQDAVSTSPSGNNDRRHHDTFTAASKASLECSTSSTSSNAATSGIRSLPNALYPNFKQQLQGQLTTSGDARHVSFQLRARSPAQPWPGQEHTPTIAAPRPSTTSVMRPSKYSTMHGMFSVFERGVSEFDRAHMLEKFDKLQSKVQQVCPRDFIVKGTPPGVKGTPVFSAFSYDNEPYKADCLNAPCHSASVTAAQPSHSSPSTCLAKRAASPPTQPSAQAPFLPVGRCSSPELALRTRADEMLATLRCQIVRDWPGSFRSVHIDSETGAVAMAFEAEAASSSEAMGLRRYMNQLARNGDTAAEFRLCKDAERWGQAEGPYVMYCFWPPWVRHATTATLPVEGLSSLVQDKREAAVAWPCRDLGRGFLTYTSLACARPLQRTMRF